MSAVDVAPFVAVALVGLVCGRFLPDPRAWVAGEALPVAHFLVSVVTGRAGEDLWTYVVPVNAVLVVIAALGVLGGRRLRPARR